MKNVLIVDIDTERENQIMFAKGKDFVLPTTSEENEKMMVEDINTLTNALNYLLFYSNKDNLRKEISEFILNYKPEEKKEENMGGDA